MSEYYQARYRDGTVYTGNQQFAGNGQKRSCGKCHTFKTIREGEFKKHGAYGLTCAACRGERQALREAA